MKIYRADYDLFDNLNSKHKNYLLGLFQNGAIENFLVVVTC